MSRLIERYIEDILTKSAPDAPYWNLESIRQGKKPHWNYIDGCMITGLLSLYEHTRETRYLEFADNFVDYYVSEDGGIRGYDINKYNIDDISEGRVLFDLYRLTGKEKYRKAIEVLVSQIRTHPRTAEGSFWHKAIYPNQVWLDGLYMGQVFYTRYETEFNGCANYDDIIMQFENVRKNMFDGEKGLYVHGFDYTREIFWADKVSGRSKNFWLRAMGWYSVALTDVIDYMNGDRRAARLEELLRECIDGIARYIDPDSGMLYQVVDCVGKAGNYPETSGSAMIAYAMLKGARTGVLDAKYAEIGKSIFDSIGARYLSQSADGINLGGICLVAGLGPKDNLRRDGSYEYYISEPVVDNDAKGLGPYLMAYTEVLRLK